MREPSSLGGPNVISNGSLFNEPYDLPLEGACITYHPAADLGVSPDQLFLRLREEVPWTQYSSLIHGIEIPQPRLSSWHGEVIHTYDSLAHMLFPHPWTPTLSLLKQRLERITGARFNSVLANCYRDGQDAIGWHADDEAELGTTPLIASLSFGAERRFDLRRTDDHGKVARILLGHGSLLVMAGHTQRNWQHSIARTRHPVGERINLTFRFTRPGY